uniref:UDP-glucuronosyltransferase n=1 Tax=Panagrolaimus sp. PS1159 TaxID=55785 RepID=A0AC35GS19_9BILA
MKKEFFAFIFITILQACLSANILLLYALYGKSHLLSYVPFLKQLASEGHNITIFYADSNKAPNFGENISTIQVDLEPNQQRAEILAKMTWNNVAHGYLFALMFYPAIEDFQQLSIYKSDKLSEVLNGNYDLILVDPVITMHGIKIAQMLKKDKNIPYFIFSSSQFLSFYQSQIALNWNYASALSLMTPIPIDNNDQFQPSKFLNRMISFLEAYSEIFLINYLTIPYSEFKMPDLKITEFYQKASLIFGDNIDRLGDPLPVGSDLTIIGSNCVSASGALDSAIPEEIENFINDPKSNGTIYIAFGTFAKWDFAPKKIIEAYLEAFKELKEYRIIFAYNGKKELNVGSNVKIVSWAPQMAILTHSKTKAFVTHGGLKSLKEALCSEVPIILMPLLAEQAHNAKFALKLKIGQIINKFSITKHQIINSIREVSNNPKYANRIKALKEQILFRPIPSLNYGSHKITKFLRMRTKFGFEKFDLFHEKVFIRKGIQIGTFAYYCFDICIAVFAFIFIILK